MPITPAAFKNEYTEFALISDEKVQAKLDSAALTIGSTWGSLQDTAIKLLVAHMLWTSPMGEPSKRGPGTVSPYLAQLDELRKGARVGFFGGHSGEDA